jgi:hypothetical protein
VRLSLGLLHGVFANLLVLVAHRLDFLGCDDSLSDELVGVDVEDRLGLTDALVHQRLSEHRLVDFVVTVATVADDIDDDVLVEGGAPFSSHAANVHDRLGVVRVDVENRSVDDTGDVGTVSGRTRVTRIGGETNLVVDDDVDGSVGGVVGQVRQMHCLEDDSLTAEGGVTVEHDGHDLLAFTVTAVELLGSGLALDDWIAGLQVRWIGDDSEADVLVGDAVQAFDVRSQVVFDITGALKSTVSFWQI